MLWGVWDRTKRDQTFLFFYGETITQEPEVIFSLPTPKTWPPSTLPIRVT